MQENTEGASAPTSQVIVKLQIACLAAPLSQHSPGHLISPPQLRVQPKLWGSRDCARGRMTLSYSIDTCLRHHENKSDLSKGLPTRTAPTMSNQRGAQAETPSSLAVAPWHPEGPWGRHLSPLPKHRDGSVPETLSLV